MRPFIALLLVASLAVDAVGAAELAVQVRGPAGEPLADAVVIAEPLDRPAPAVLAPRAIIDQIGKRFVPRVSVLRTGTSVSFPNHDDIRHSVYSYSPPKRFNLKLYAGTPSEPVVFDKPGVVVMGCNIHDTMIAWVVVVDTPWQSRSGADGLAHLHELPPGRYRVRGWHEPMAELAAGQELVVTGDAPAQFEVRLDPQ